MKRACAVVMAALAGAAFALPASAADEGAAVAELCPGAVAWWKAHPEATDEAMATRDAARTLLEPALRAELDRRVARDQKVRRDILAWPSSLKAQRTMNQVDDSNAVWLSELVASRGFPTAAQVGEQGVRDAYLLLHHVGRSSPLKEALLPVLEKRFADGDLSADDLARFTDRILKGQGERQRYGTQFSPEAMGGTYFGLPDEASLREVEANRRALGVMPLADYTCTMRVARSVAPERPR
jgi:hypothetical protein